MKIGKKFNQLTIKEYFHAIDNDKKYTDFNVLGLYRSIIENDKLNVEEKKLVREYAHIKYEKTFNFLQLKDPKTYFNVLVIGLDLIKPEVDKIWHDIILNQQKILLEKNIKHKNFGIYSKHICGDKNCRYYGLMIKQNSPLSECTMNFPTDKNKFEKKSKSTQRKLDRKHLKNIIKENFEE